MAVPVNDKRERAMAMVKCGECGAEVSSKAPACVKCGAPIAAESQAAGAALTTTQGTSKKLKALTLLAWVMIIAGVVMFSTALPDRETAAAGEAAEPPMTAALLFVAGILLWIITKFRRWWHHG
jgi:DNA-directed RNA polymerase subunit RPC12/RpoP